MKVSLKHKLIKLSLLSIFIFSLTFPTMAEVNLDSLKQIWVDNVEPDSQRFKAIKQYYIGNTFAQPDTVLIVTDYHYNLAEEKKNKKEMANALNEKSFAHYLKGDVNTATEWLNESIKLVEQLNDPIALATMYANLGTLYGEQQKYQEAVRYFTLTVEIFRKEGKEVEEAQVLNNLGVIYSYIDNYVLALDYFEQALSVYEKYDMDLKGETSKNIGLIYYEQKIYDKAIDKCEKALEILVESNNKFSESGSYFILAKSYHKLNQNDKALAYLEKSLEIDNELKNNSRIVERLTFEAELAYDTDVNIATSKAEEVLKILKEETSQELKADLYQVLYKCYKAQNKYSRSLQMHEKYVIHNDSVQVEKNDFAIIKEAIQNEFDAKLYENQLKNEQAQAELKLSQLRKTYSILLGGLLLILCIVFYTRSNIISQRKEKEVLLEEIDQLKKTANSSANLSSSKFQLDRNKIEEFINRKINETDWKVLNILLNDPVISNKDIAKEAFLTVDGIGSCLRRMYVFFDTKESKYKKISLIMKAIKLSNE